MITSDELVFRFNEDNFDIAVVSNRFNKFKIKSVDTFEIIYDGGNVIYDSGSNINQVEKYLDTKNKQFKEAKVIISLDGIITRLIETPLLNKRDLKKFINNNLKEYFTINLNDYYFDYKVASFKGRKNKKLNIILCAFPKLKLDDIYSFIKHCNLIPQKITIYPECIANTFRYLSEESVAILDLNNDRNIITILNDGNIFLYSILQGNTYSNSKDKLAETIDNIGYFLNFYSTRHFGSKVEQIYIIGEKSEDKELYKNIKASFGIETVRGILDNDINFKYVQNIEVNKYADILGGTIKNKDCKGKSINFARVIDDAKDYYEKKLINEILISLFGATILFWILMFGYFKFYMIKYDTSGFGKKLEQVKVIEKRMATLNDENKKFQVKEKNLKTMSDDNFNYIAYLEALKSGLPSNTSVNEVSFDKDKMDISLNINSPMDKMKVVIAINKMQLFEPIELDSIKFDNSEKEAKFALKIIKPL